MNKTIVISLIRKLYPGVVFIAINVKSKTMQLKKVDGSEITQPADAYSQHLPELAEGYEMKYIDNITIDLKTKEINLYGDKQIKI